MSKLYLFRDLSNNDNLEDGKSYHAAGYVAEVYGDSSKPSVSGKDLTVVYCHPFTMEAMVEWRSFSDVELFEIDAHEYNEVVRRYAGEVS